MSTISLHFPQIFRNFRHIPQFLRNSFPFVLQLHELEMECATSSSHSSNAFFAKEGRSSSKICKNLAAFTGFGKICGLGGFGGSFTFLSGIDFNPEKLCVFDQPFFTGPSFSLNFCQLVVLFFGSGVMQQNLLGI